MSSDKRIALVTGSSSGIGRAEAVALAKAGYDVVINYSKSEREARSTAGACEKLGSKTLVLQCDVAETAMSLIEGNKSVTGMIVVVDGGFSAVT